jgi:hypothetical protein
MIKYQYLQYSGQQQIAIYGDKFLYNRDVTKIGGKWNDNLECWLLLNTVENDWKVSDLYERLKKIESKKEDDLRSIQSSTKSDRHSQRKFRRAMSDSDSDNENKKVSFSDSDDDDFNHNERLKKSPKSDSSNSPKNERFRFDSTPHFENRHSIRNRRDSASSDETKITSIDPQIARLLKEQEETETIITMNALKDNKNYLKSSKYSDSSNSDSDSERFPVPQTPHRKSNRDTERDRLFAKLQDIKRQLKMLDESSHNSRRKY